MCLFFQRKSRAHKMCNKGGWRLVVYMFDVLILTADIKANVRQPQRPECITSSKVDQISQKYTLTKSQNVIEYLSEQKRYALHVESAKFAVLWRFYRIFHLTADIIKAKARYPRRPERITSSKVDLHKLNIK